MSPALFFSGVLGICELHVSLYLLPLGLYSLGSYIHCSPPYTKSINREYGEDNRPSEYRGGRFLSRSNIRLLFKLPVIQIVHFMREGL